MWSAFARTLVALLVLRIAPELALAQTGSAAQRDWTGVYSGTGAHEIRGTDLKQEYPGEELNKLIIPHLQPWAKARMEATDGIADDTGQVCLPDGIFRFPNMVGRFIWLEERGRILMVFENINTAGVRRIYLDRPHPKNPPPTWNGHSIGRWEGDTLVVDTVGFSEKSWLFGGMEPHTEETHMIERFRMVANGTYLEATVTVEDRHALTSAYSFKRYYKRQPENAEMAESVCNEDPETWKQFRNEALKKHMDRAKQVQ